jgi:hypothetical protein
LPLGRQQLRGNRLDYDSLRLHGLGLAILHGFSEGSNAAPEASAQLGEPIAPREEQQHDD